MIAHLLLGGLLAATANGPVKHATDVRAKQDDELTQQFADALRKAIPKAKRMREETGDDKDDLYFAVLFRVDPDGKRFGYSVDLMKDNQYSTPDRLASMTGNCRKDAMDSCARDIVSKADKKVRD